MIYVALIFMILNLFLIIVYCYDQNKFQDIIERHDKMFDLMRKQVKDYADENYLLTKKLEEYERSKNQE